MRKSILITLGIVFGLFGFIEYLASAGYNPGTVQPQQLGQSSRAFNTILCEVGTSGAFICM